MQYCEYKRVCALPACPVRSQRPLRTTGVQEPVKVRHPPLYHTMCMRDFGTLSFVYCVNQCAICFHIARAVVLMCPVSGYRHQRNAPLPLCYPNSILVNYNVLLTWCSPDLPPPARSKSAQRFLDSAWLNLALAQVTEPRNSLLQH